MQQTNFSQNFNGKLFLDHFGDVREYDPERYAEGTMHEIFVGKTYLGTASVMAIKNFKFKQLRDTFSFINCAHHSPYQANLLNRFYNSGNMLDPDTELYHVVWKWETRMMDNHRILLKDWWEEKVQQQPFLISTENPIS